MRKLIYFGTAAFALTIIAVSCKPTEKNYKLAYEKAIEKKRQGLTDEQYTLMLEESLPKYAHSATDSVRTFAEHIIWQYTPEAVDSGRKADPMRYNLAIGKYSMLSNAKAHADRLAADGWESRVYRTGEPIYYVVVKQSSALDTVAQAARAYSARYPSGTISLHEPMAITPAGM